MERTAEVRWFFEGPLHAPFVRRFERLGAAEPRARVDRYLRLPETDALGVKARGGAGSFELKLRLDDHGEREVVDGVEGRIEEWGKWVFSTVQDGPAAGPLGLAAHDLVDVHKARRLLTYAPPDWGPSVPAERGDGDGCNVELTVLGVEGGEWSTLGFEAFGSESTIVESLARAAAAFFGDAERPEGLTAGASYSYPGWLRLVAGRPER